ncbi:MAG: DUF1320 domain-containing protein [Sulfuricurvum sp.]|nr:DUF1320 domain-containing protein [Sulfuricurvum sp.]
MPYCSLIDITSTITADEVLQLTDDIGTGSIDTAKVDEAIAKSDGLINAFIGGDILDPVPELIRQISVELSIYHLFKRRFASNMPDSIEKEYSHAMDLLKQIQSGKLSIGSTATEQTAPSRHYKTNKTSADRLFGKSRLRSY